MVTRTKVGSWTQLPEIGTTWHFKMHSQVVRFLCLLLLNEALMAFSSCSLSRASVKHILTLSNVPKSPYSTKSPTGIDRFEGPALDPEWEWNHNPDTTKFSANNRLCLQPRQSRTIFTVLATHSPIGYSDRHQLQPSYWEISRMAGGGRAGLKFFGTILLGLASKWKLVWPKS